MFYNRVCEAHPLWAGPSVPEHPPPPPNTLLTEEGAPEKRLDPHANNGGSEVDEPVGKEWRDSQKHDVPQHVLVVSANLHIKIKKIITAANNFFEQRIYLTLDIVVNQLIQLEVGSPKVTNLNFLNRVKSII